LARPSLSPARRGNQVLDQHQEVGERVLARGDPRVTQTFRPVFGNVSAISALLTGPAAVTIRLRCPVRQPLATETKSTDVAGWVRWTSSSIVVVAEAEYAIEITGTYSGPTPSWFGGIQRNPYARGRSISVLANVRLRRDLPDLFGDGLVPVVTSPWGEVKNLYR
jgi:hypothetical protein